MHSHIHSVTGTSAASTSSLYRYVYIFSCVLTLRTPPEVYNGTIRK
eukprot:SAG22_NODE_607_length_8603_cov_4.554327_10_plen_45_part_01